MAKTICFDFGNTRLKAAFFDEDKIIDNIVLFDDSPATIEKLINDFLPEKSILSSVINHNPEVEQILERRTKFHLLNHNTKINFTIPIGNPETIGADRLALCAAAVHFFPKKHNLVIALGSCITYNYINTSHQFLGGGISPGLEMRLKAMNHFTAKLPLVAPATETPLIGYDTETNMLSGAVLGMAFEIDGFIDAYNKKYNNFNVLLTGGDSIHLAPHLKNRIFADPNLIFKGLYAISETNNA